MKNLCIYFTITLFFVSPLLSDPVRVLILSGRNNHDWKQTTPIIQSFLEATTQISVNITESPEQLTKEDLRKVDVILSNWNNFGKTEDGQQAQEWSESTRNAYIEFVRNGGGHVVIHGGSSSFYDWDDYFAITLMRWKTGHTSHGKKRTFKVRIDEVAGPILREIEDVPFHDELWRKPEVHRDATVAASSYSESTTTWEPCIFIGNFGKGRCWSTTLGHDVESLSNPILQKLLIHAVLWSGRFDEKFDGIN